MTTLHHATWNQFRDYHETQNDRIVYIQFREDDNSDIAPIRVLFIHMNGYGVVHTTLPPRSDPFWEGKFVDFPLYLHIPSRVKQVRGGGACRITTFIHPFSGEISINRGIVRSTFSSSTGNVSFEDTLDLEKNAERVGGIPRYFLSGHVRSKRHSTDLTLRAGVVYRLSEIPMPP